MANILKSALPSHLKPSGLGNGDAANAEFAKKHHGKTQSHMIFHLAGICASELQLPSDVHNRQEQSRLGK
ncbi:hypothetical protein LSUE1_G005636 [Lachnellula suecica]|uniref:Uncharacterized protein n=1 Tax=Lachnellula suecica TaxID=602035 RepID=A0A8T9C754_9HELO|nr:hypothetical protein LSUE1_G005636 [Lachnellula suecica]